MSAVSRPLTATLEARFRQTTLAFLMRRFIRSHENFVRTTKKYVSWLYIEQLCGLFSTVFSREKKFIDWVWLLHL